MASVDKYVQIQISRQTQTVAKRAFGWALVLSAHSLWSDRVRWYDQATWAADMLGDGFVTTNPAYLAAEAYFGQQPCPTQIAVGRRGGAEDADTALTACLAADSSFYGVMITDRDAVQVYKAIVWTEANKRLFVNASYDASIVDSTLLADTSSLAARNKSMGNERTGMLFTRGGGPYGSLYPEAAWLGGRLPYPPGTINWAHKPLSGITTDPLTNTQSKNAHDKYCSTYETIGANNCVEEGWTGAGDFLDITQACDWLEASLQEAVWGVLVALPRVPFTDQGIGLLYGAMNGVFKTATDNGVLQSFDPRPIPADNYPGDYFTLPASADISRADRALRTLNAPKCFQRRLAGAINHVAVTGNITL
jgi:hypothetical protein